MDAVSFEEERRERSTAELPELRALVTGGSGVIGKALIPGLLDAGYQVRLLGRSAERTVADWPERAVEPWSANVADPKSLEGAADGSDVVIHAAGIVAESSADATFRKVNVEGTANMVREAERGGVGWFIYLSSLGADRGSSGYHRSKREAESLVEGFRGAWTILRPGNVYGPGDDVISSLLLLVRSFPAVPVVGGGDQSFQPMWTEDMTAAVVATLRRDDLAGRTLELAGTDRTSMNDLLDRLQRLEERDPPRVSVPAALADVAARAAESLPLAELIRRVAGVDFPLDPARVAMLQEESVLEYAENDLVHVLGVTPVPLDDGLRRLAAAIPERLPEDGAGPLQRKRFSALIADASMNAEQLMTLLRRELTDLLPVDFLDGPAGRAVEAGDTLRLRLPGRGHVAVRAVRATSEEVVLATVQGHPLAGLVRFTAEVQAETLEFMIEVHARASGLYDLFLMAAAGEGIQTSAWEEAVRRVVDRSKGRAPAGVQVERAELDEEEARAVQEWAAGLVRERKAGA